MPDEIPHRTFRTDEGREWHVWQVNPDAAALEYVREGWLCFESGEERRRFAPIPHGWEHLADEILRFILSVSSPVAQKRQGNFSAGAALQSWSHVLGVVGAALDR